MKYLKVWTDFESVLSVLDDAEAGRLFRNMLHYASTGEEPEYFEGNERFVWPVARRDIDIACAIAEKNRENGLRPKVRFKRDEATESEPKRTEATISETEQNEAEARRKEKKRNEKKGNEKKFIQPTIDEVRAYCTERGNKVDPQRFIDHYTSNGWMVGKNKMKDWKAAVRTWERSETPAKVVAAQQYTQRDYDNEQEEAMRRMLKGVV